MTRCGGEHHFVDYGAGLLGILFEIVGECLAYGLRHYALNLIVAKFGLGLALKLRFGHLDRNHSRQTIAEVLFRKLNLELVEKMIVVGIFLQAAAEAGEVSATLDCVDVVDI